jgi:hypothetical protein
MAPVSVGSKPRETVALHRALTRRRRPIAGSVRRLTLSLRPDGSCGLETLSALTIPGPALDAGTGIGLQFEGQRPGASEARR